MTNTKISEILKAKGSEVFTVDSSTDVVSCANQMVEKRVGALVVTNGQGAARKIAGIVSERDCLRYLADQESPPDDTRVSGIMTRDVVAILPSNTLEQAMAIMTRKRCRHLPVVENEKISGLISIGDLVKQAAQDHQAEIHYLTEYIMGNYPAVEHRGSGIFATPTTPPSPA